MTGAGYFGFAIAPTATTILDGSSGSESVTAPQLHRAPAIEKCSNCFRASKAYREVFRHTKLKTEALPEKCSMSPVGTFRTCRDFQIESAFGGNAEVGFSFRQGPLVARSSHSYAE